MDLGQLHDQHLELMALQDQLPACRLWQEPGRDGMRFHCRSASLDINPRIVITSDLDELREVLLQAQQAQAASHDAPPP